MNTKKLFYTVAVISPILLLSGCNPLKWFSGDKTEKASDMMEKGVDVSGNWVVKVGDKVVVSLQEFQNDFNALLDEKPQLKAMRPLMPNLEQDFAKGLSNYQAILQYVEENKIDQTPEYLAEKARMTRAVEQMLNQKFFAEAFPIAQLSDADAKKFYDEHKDSLQGILISRGGVAARGVSFDTKADADAFYKKVKGVKNLDLEKVAKEQKVDSNYRDFDMVHAQSFGLDPVLRPKIVALNKFPRTDVLSVGDKTFWVVHSSKKEESQYRSFEEVKEGVKQVAQQTEKAKHLQAELDTLTEKYNVQINDGYFQEKVAKANAEAVARRALQERQAAAADSDVKQMLPAEKTV